MVKWKFGDSVRSKMDQAMMNEVVCKLPAHNICCVIAAWYELGIALVFGGGRQRRGQRCYGSGGPGEGIAMQTTTIHVRLLDEAVDVWRPVQARRLDTGTYEIVSVNDDPDVDHWEFTTGDTVRCREEMKGGDFGRLRMCLVPKEACPPRLGDRGV
jgi:hypothetical protein